MAEALSSGAKAQAVWRAARERLRSLGSTVDVPLSSCVLFALAGTIIGWCLAAEAVIKAGGYPLGFWPEAWRYADSNLPMIHTADGFLFISMAKQALVGGYAGIQPFAQVTAVLAKALGTPVENMAFQMSLLVHLGLGLIVAFWARIAGLDRLGAFIAALLVPLVPAWLERGGPGQYDTDLAITLLLQAGLILMAKASLGLKESDRPAFFLAGAATCFALMYWVWPNGALGLAAPAFGLWFLFFMPLRLMGLKRRLTVIALVALWGALILLFPDMTLAPRAVTAFLHGKVASYLGMPTFVTVNDYTAYGFHTDMLARSVQELASIPLPALLERLGGSTLGGLFMLAAAALALLKSQALRFPVLFSLVWVALGTRSLRLLYLGTFPLCLAVGALPCLAAAGFPRLSQAARGLLAKARLHKLPVAKPWLMAGIGLATSMALAMNCFQWRAHHGVEVRWDRAQDALLEPVRQDMGDAPAYMWNWWDDGYFLMARLGAKATAHFNGGGTNPLKGYIPGHSFVMENREVAARWMRFFAVRGQAEAIKPAIDVWGPEAAWGNVERVLAGEAVPGVEKIENWREWFFPKGKVYLYLPGYIFSISNWWVPLGLSRDPDMSLVRPHIERIKRGDFVYNPETQALTVDMSLYNRGYKDFGMVINTMQMPLAPPWPSAKAPYIVYSGQNHFAYIADQLGVRTLPLYMMAPGGPPLPQFRQVAFEPIQGGIWEVMDDGLPAAEPEVNFSPPPSAEPEAKAAPEDAVSGETVLPSQSGAHKVATFQQAPKPKGAPKPAKQKKRGTN